MNLQQFIGAKGRHLEVPRGQHIFRQGDRDPSLYVVKSGLLKAYYLTESGKEQVKSFLFPGEFIGSLAAAYAGDPCSFSLVSLQKSEAMAIPLASQKIKARLWQTRAAYR
jgi:CRP-like cAMP-binding protein